MRGFGTVVLVIGLCASAAMAQQGADWSYDGKQGPLNWGRLDPAYRACSQGKQQSPIDIRGAHRDKSLQPIEFHYVSGAMTLLNTGHMIEVTPAKGSYIVANGVRYELQGFEFHHPSETAVNGKLPDMSVQMLHKSADGKMAIVAILLNEGNANALLAELWPHLPKTAGTSDKMTESMSPAGLLPADRGYWTYQGSLTSPPCTEGVEWYVFQQPVQLSRDQLRSFAAIYRVNSRLLQATKGRKIRATE